MKSTENFKETLYFDKNFNQSNKENYFYKIEKDKCYNINYLSTKEKNQKIHFLDLKILVFKDFKLIELKKQEIYSSKIYYELYNLDLSKNSIYFSYILEKNNNFITVFQNNKKFFLYTKNLENQISYNKIKEISKNNKSLNIYYEIYTKNKKEKKWYDLNNITITNIDFTKIIKNIENYKITKEKYLKITFKNKDIKNFDFNLNEIKEK